MSEEEQERPRIQHDHKLSLLRDEDFAKQSHKLLGYLVAAQSHIPCIHVDHPSVQAIEVMAQGLAMSLGFPPRVAEALEMTAHVFFAAGQQYGSDGNHSTAHPKYTPDYDLTNTGQTEEEWLKLHQEQTTKWRENIREQFYGPEKNALAELLERLSREQGADVTTVELGPEASEFLTRVLRGQKDKASNEDDRSAGPYL